ncbi:substrate-binding domain-containing protein, partial [Enterococcus lactis]|uniref:substrate-binding domain-containing protein n=1 Tax=Enterococcus lactis TaxID=357441 RepID=UPI0039081B37
EFCFLENYKNGTYPFSENYQQYLLDAFRTQEQLPDVFFCANDFVAIDVLQVFQKLKITVPNDVWLCGFDDAPESRIVTPSLSTVHI